MLYSCTHMATVGFKGTARFKSVWRQQQLGLTTNSDNNDKNRLLMPIFKVLASWHFNECRLNAQAAVNRQPSHHPTWPLGLWVHLEAAIIYTHRRHYYCSA